MAKVVVVAITVGCWVVACLVLPAAGVAQDGDIDDYIAGARATPTPTPTPELGDPITDGLFWVYLRVRAGDAAEMNEDGCSVRDEALDQTIYEGDPFVVANKDGTILQEGEFAGTTRVRAEQTPWRPGTNDQGWTADDGTRLCRFQGRLDILAYSPSYLIAFGEKARGPYEVSWETVTRNGGRMVLDIDLASSSEEPIVRTPFAFSEVSDSGQPSVTERLAVEGDTLLVYADYLQLLPKRFLAWATFDDGRRVLLFEESADFSGVTEIPTEGSQYVRFEVEAGGAWTLVAH